MSIKPSTDQKNKMRIDNKWDTYEQHKKKLSCKYGWGSKRNPGKYERAVRLLCKIIRL
jgi:hypothetical protein